MSTCTKRGTRSVQSTNGLVFRAVVLYGEGGGPTFDGCLMHAAAAVEMLTDNPEEWVLPDHMGALRFVLAGALAEIAILGHAIPNGFVEDIRVWRRGLGRLEASTQVELDGFLGTPLLGIKEDVEGWAAENASRIERVAAALSATSAPGELSYADVVQLLA